MHIMHGLAYRHVCALHTYTNEHTHSAHTRKNARAYHVYTHMHVYMHAVCVCVCVCACVRVCVCACVRVCARTPVRVLIHLGGREEECTNTVMNGEGQGGGAADPVCAIRAIRATKRLRN